MERAVRIAVDAHGGDLGCGTVVGGLIAAMRSVPESFSACLCGSRSEVLSSIERAAGTDFCDEGRLLVEDCPDIIPMGQSPSLAWKRHPRSSLARCLALQSEGAVDASLSAGDTRFILGAAIFLLGRKPGISRPALAAFLPTIGERQVLLLDVGANVGCKASHLADFGLMGWHYVRQFSGLDAPVVSLLNVGDEAWKGTDTVRDAAALLEKRLPRAVGFIEGSKVLSGEADVVVCDGFPGNVLLKACESFHHIVKTLAGGENEFDQTLAARVSVLNSDNYGAVPLLGVEGVVFKAHGSSSERAIAHAVRAAVKAASQGLGHITFA